MPKLDGAPLIAFLKAMEFTTITRRVGEICGVDANAIEPDPRFVGAGGWRGRNGEAVAPSAATPRLARSAAPSDKPAAPAHEPEAPAGERTPQGLAAARAARGARGKDRRRGLRDA